MLSIHPRPLAVNAVIYGALWYKSEVLQAPVLPKRGQTLAKIINE
jgi:hypothetical protein